MKTIAYVAFLRTRRTLVIGSLGAAASIYGGCSDDAVAGGDGGDGSDVTADAGTDARAGCVDGCANDGGAERDTATPDAGVDGATTADSGLDATADSGLDAATDSGLDAATDTGVDAAADSSVDAGPAQRVGGRVTGLLAGTVVLTDNGVDDLVVTKNGAFEFATAVLRGGGYDVSVKTQPPGQFCTVAASKGSVLVSDVTDVAVTCTDTLACPAGSSASKQTVCGRVYDLADDTAVQADALCTACSAATSTGPCSLKLTAYDALSFASNPAAASPLTAAESVIDTCGRFRLADLALGASGSVVLLLDDAAGLGPTGNTVTVATGVANAAAGATTNVETWLAAPALVQGWATGGPSLASGIYAPIFRAHTAPETDRFANASGVAVTKMASTVPAQDSYFVAAALTRATVDAAANVTGANGTALVSGASLADGVSWSGTGIADSTNCKWETKSAVSIPSVLWVQIFRPTNQTGKTCTL